MTAAPHRYRAYGVTFDSELELPALAPLVGDGAGAGDAPPDPTRVVRAAPTDLAARWPGDPAVERVLQEGDPGSPDERFVERHPEAGHRLYAGGFGEAVVAADGRTVSCAATGASEGRLERFLVGRVLPWAALVRGHELFHGAAVVLDGHALVLIGPSGAGKTSLAVQLMLAGARFLTDDVLAVELAADGTPLAHPGARVAGLRAPERARLDAGQRGALGALRTLDDKDYATFAVDPAPVALGAVVFVTRPEQDGPAIERLQARSADVLLASAFIVSVRTPERLRHQLSVCAAVAASVPLYRARVTGDRDASALAAIIARAVRRDRRPGP